MIYLDLFGFIWIYLDLFGFVSILCIFDVFFRLLNFVPGVQDAGCAAVEKAPIDRIVLKPVSNKPKQLPKSGLPLHWASQGSTVDVMALLADPSQANKRTLDSHLVQLQEALDPENCVEDEYNPVHNKACRRGCRVCRCCRRDLCCGV